MAIYICQLQAATSAFIVPHPLSVERKHAPRCCLWLVVAEGRALFEVGAALRPCAVDLLFCKRAPSPSEPTSLRPNTGEQVQEVHLCTLSTPGSNRRPQQAVLSEDSARWVSIGGRRSVCDGLGNNIDRHAAPRHAMLHGSHKPSHDDRAPGSCGLLLDLHEAGVGCLGGLGGFSKALAFVEIEHPKENVGGADAKEEAQCAVLKQQHLMIDSGGVGAARSARTLAGHARGGRGCCRDGTAVENS